MVRAAPSRATTVNGPPWMCIGWMSLVFEPMNRTRRVSPTFMSMVSVAGYAFPLMVK